MGSGGWNALAFPEEKASGRPSSKQTASAGKRFRDSWYWLRTGGSCIRLGDRWMTLPLRSWRRIPVPQMRVIRGRGELPDQIRQRFDAVESVASIQIPLYTESSRRYEVFLMRGFRSYVEEIPGTQGSH